MNIFKILRDNHYRIITAILMTIIFIGKCNAQDSLTIDSDLGNKINYMAWKARQFDTLIYNQKLINESFVEIIAQGDSIINNLTKENDGYIHENTNLKLENKVLIEDNRLLRESNSEKSVVITDCEEKLEIKDKKILNLKHSRNESIKGNIGMGTILVITLAVVIINSTK